MTVPKNKAPLFELCFKLRNDPFNIEQRMRRTFYGPNAPIVSFRSVYQVASEIADLHSKIQPGGR